MRQAIQTTFRGPTNTRGARIVAQADAGRLNVPWDYSQSVAENHRHAALALAALLGWEGPWHGGSLPGAGYVFVTEA